MKDSGEDEGDEQVLRGVSNCQKKKHRRGRSTGYGQGKHIHNCQKSNIENGKKRATRFFRRPIRMYEGRGKTLKEERET